ncbi:hypothetical protein ABH931_002357 [Streptacidiphilus sp. MAP12-33]|uniref:hypothetical protein n=1 Tax=Streptacidiphilus sp. MAP12-33 TaxID=3156266 RepID=UPI003512714F
MIGDLWVLVTLLETPARNGAPVDEPRMLALTEAGAVAEAVVGGDRQARGHDTREEDQRAGDPPADKAGAPARDADEVAGLIPVDRVEWDAWRGAASAYLAAVSDAGRGLALAERRAQRAASRILPGARRRAARDAESAVRSAAADYADAVRAATTTYWPIHCEIQRRLDSQSTARRWVEIRSALAGRGTEPVWGWSLRELDPERTPGLVELTVFRWDGTPPAAPADFVSPEHFGAPDLDRELLRLRAEWTVQRIVWEESARLRVEEENDGIPFALWWRAVTARVDAAEKVIPPRSSEAAFAAPAPGPGRRRVEVLQLPE